MITMPFQLINSINLKIIQNDEIGAYQDIENFLGDSTNLLKIINPHSQGEREYAFKKIAINAQEVLTNYTELESVLNK